MLVRVQVPLPVPISFIRYERLDENSGKEERLLTAGQTANYAPIVQLAEHSAHNRIVSGSSPDGSTNKNLMEVLL